MENIEFEDFKEVELRIGKIKDAEKVENSDKLLKLIVYFDKEERTIVSGVAEYYDPEDVIGKEVVVVYNLEPRKIFGILSQGMILFAKGKEKPVFLIPEESVASGSIIS